MGTRHDSLLGARSSLDGPHLRVVDALVGHEAVTFRTLCERVVPPSTRYLVLDLDRTCHLGHNMGELLGWELIARRAYGERYLADVEDQRTPGRVLTRWGRPASTLRYFGRGVRLWGLPGLFYFVWTKVGTRYKPTRRWLFGRYGSEPVSAVQHIPRLVLLHHLSALPLETLRELAASVWRRHAPDQVVSAEALAWLRTRCPELRIILCSASPQPVVEAAAAALGVDDAMYTEVEEHDGYLSAPAERRRAFMLWQAPRRISPPSRLSENAGIKKMARLLARYPDFTDPDVETVGISDTSYGEDRSWAHYFKTVVDINSPSPFSPFVAAGSPVRSIHSAAVLTRDERERGTHDRERGVRDARRQLERDELLRILGPEVAAVEALADTYARELAALDEPHAESAAQRQEIVARIDETVASYNAADTQPERRRSLRAIDQRQRELRALEAREARLERPLSKVACELTRRLQSARSALEPHLSGAEVSRP